MSKNGAVIILNDIKKERNLIEDKYNKQKNKRVSIKEKLIYIFGFVALFCLSCMFIASNFPLVVLTLGGYAIGVPLIYSYIEFSKELNLKRKLDKLNKTIDNLEFELNGIQVKHQYVNNPKQFIVESKQNNKPFIPTYNEEEQPEEGPKLRLRK